MNGTTPVHTVTALKRWSCAEKQMPAVEGVRNIHIYDFDNTLFSSPLPNRQLWNAGTCGSLQAQDFLHNGGWWHNPAILSATGQGLEIEEGRAWQGFWNEKIVELCQLSAADEDTLSVMLTGRGEANFWELLRRMIESKGLDFDMMCLKPSVSPSGELFASTLAYKQALLRDIVYTYSNATEIRIYEDRPKHTKAFRDFFTDFNRSLSNPSTLSPVHRAPIRCEVVQVTEQETTMDPTTETACVQSMINAHNTAILNNTGPLRAVPYKLKRTVFFTGYLLTPQDTEKIKSLVKLPPTCPEHEVKWLANNILISPRPSPRSLLEKVGGLGGKVRWRVTGLGNWNQRVWAARVAPVDPNTNIHTENTTPSIVVALRRETKPVEATKISSWQPVAPDKAMEFETTVGEKVMLRIEEEFRDEDPYESSFANNGNGRQQQGRKHPRDEDFPALGSGHGQNKGLRPQFRGGGYHNNNNNENRNPNSSSSWAGKAGAGAGGGGGNNGIGFSSQRGGGGGRGGQNRGGGRGGGFRGHRGGGGGGGGAGGRGGRGGRGQYRSLDDNVPGGGGYSEAGGMQY